jgi:hypothetical protein
LTKAFSPGVVAVAIPPAWCEQLAQAARKLGLNVCPENADALLRAAMIYSVLAAGHRLAPKKSEVSKKLGKIKRSAKILLAELENPAARLDEGAFGPDQEKIIYGAATEAFSRLGQEQDRLSDGRITNNIAVETLATLVAAARAAATTLPKSKTGPDPGPHFANFVLASRRIYEAAGGDGRGIYWDPGARRYSGKLLHLIDRALEITGDTSPRDHEGFGKAIERIL